MWETWDICGYLGSEPTLGCGVGLPLMGGKGDGWGRWKVEGVKWHDATSRLRLFFVDDW